MKTWSTWFPDLLPQLPGCPDPLIEHELLRACQTFFTRTRAWQVVQPLVAITANQTTLDIVPSDSTQDPVRIEAAWLDGQRLAVMTAGDMDKAFTDDWQLHTGSTSTIVQITPNTLMLYPIPVAASSTGLKLRLSVKPGDTATGIPDDMYSKYKDALTDGALSRLMLQADKKWTNDQKGMIKAASFEASMGTVSALSLIHI